MIAVLTTLTIVAVGLFIASFFMGSQKEELEAQIEQLSLDMMQHNYQTNKKLKLLEEELITEDLTDEIIQNHQHTPTETDHLSPEETIVSMHERGYKAHYIAKQLDMKEEEVRKTINSREAEGVLT